MTCKITWPNGIVLESDTALTLTHSYRNRATQHPVEDGASVSDHVIREPRSAQLDLVFSSHPLREGLLPSGGDRPQQAFAILAGIMERKDVVDVQVDGENYSPAVIVSLSEPRALADGDSRRFQIEVQEIYTVSADTATAATKSLARRLRHKGKPKRKVQPSATPADLKLAALGRIAVGDWVGATVLGTVAIAR
jgi:hypothetical protein